MEFLKNLFNLDPESQAKLEKLKGIRASEAYFNAIIGALEPGKYDKVLADNLVSKLGSQWLHEHASKIFPHIDEFEINSEITIRTNDYDQHEKHARMTLRQLSAWIDYQKQQLHLK